VEARSQGNLVTTPEQEVREDGGYVEIWPAQPQYMYVPVYDPALIYFRPGFAFGISFGRAFFIGAWLNHDFDWGGHRVFYHGWEGGGGWIGRSRPFIRVNNFYVNVNYRNVFINRTVMNRSVNYGALNRYQSVHRDVHYDNVRVNNYNRTVVNNTAVINRPVVGNRIIDRNINVNDQRINSYRGQAPQAPPQTNRPAVQTQEWRNERPDNSAFGGNHGGFGAQAASQRGQASRAEVARPTAPPKLAPQDSRDRRR